MSKILGLATIAVDGLALLSDAAATLDPGGYMRPVQKGNVILGFREEIAESKLEVSVAIDASFSIDAYRNITNSTVSFAADTGQTWAINGAWLSEPPNISQKDGKAKLVFLGPPADEVT
ncbi:MAG: phage tail tube protein [Caulobacteraceae bacterium]